MAAFHPSRIHLDHIKPHKPLLAPPINRTINHINHIVQNNIRFCLNLQIKNRMVSRSYLPLAYTEASDKSLSFYTELPFERYGLLMSDYEWYLHTSRLKDIYKKQKEFIRVMEKRQVGQSNFLSILQSGESYDVTSPMSVNPGGVAPTIYYVTPKADPPPAAEHTVSTHTQTVSENKIHEQTTQEIRVERITPGEGVSSEHIAQRVAKVLEDKWHLDRLRKGG